MNPPRTSSFVIAATAVLVSLAAAASSALADDGLGLSKALVALRLEYIEADHALIRRWALDPQNDWDAAAMRAALREQVAAGKASVLDQSWIITNTGQRAKAESVAEYIFPVQFDPPEVPQELAGPIDPAADIMTQVTPTAMDTLKLGAITEIDPIWLPERGWAKVNAAPELTSREGDRLIGQGSSQERQPAIYSMRTAASLLLEPGRWLLVGIHAPPPEELGKEPAADRRVAVFARAEVVELTEPPKPSPQEEPDPFDPEASREPDLRLLAELIEVPASAAAALLDQHPPDAEKLSLDCYLAAAALIESGEATLRHAATCELSVNRARARSGTEVIYPIEWDPPEISPKITGPVEAANQLITEVTPTAFETRLTGVTLEAMMGWRQGDRLSASIAFERVRLAGKTEFGQNQSQIEQPLFYTQSCATAVGLQVGKPLILSLHRELPKDPALGLESPEKVALLFVRAAEAK